MAGRPDWSGTPLVHGFTSLFTFNQTIAASGSFNTGTPTPVDAPGYVIELGVVASGVSTNPLCTVTVDWFDLTGTVIVAESVWTIVGTTAGSWLVFGQGPVRGPFCRVTLVNGDTANTMTVRVRMLTCTHHISRDDWRSGPTASVVPGFTFTDGQNMPANILGDWHTTFAAGTFTQLLPLYAGQAFLSFVSQSTPAAGGQLIINVQPVPAVSHGIAFDYTNTAVPVNPGVAVVAQIVTLPREQCQIQFVNNGTQSVTFNGMLIAQEYAS